LSLRLLERSVQMLAGAALWVAILAVLLPGVAEAQQGTTASTKDDPNTRNTVVVDPGDSLWSISSERLGPNATPRQIDKEIERIYALNRDRIGPDPNLIFPGQKLLVAPAEEGKPVAARQRVAADRRVADRSIERALSEPASEKAARTPLKTSTTTDLQAEPAVPPALPAPREAVPKAGSLRAEGDPLTRPTVDSFASSPLFALVITLVIIVLAVCPVALLVWTLRMRERLEVRRRRSWWVEHYGKNYTRFDPFLRFEDTLRSAPGVPDEPELGPNGSAPAAGNGLNRVGIFAAARARRSTRLPRSRLAAGGVYSPKIRRHLRTASSTRRRRRVPGAFPQQRKRRR
jgi:LysM domain-containing protein